MKYIKSFKLFENLKISKRYIKDYATNVIATYIESGYEEEVRISGSATKMNKWDIFPLMHDLDSKRIAIDTLKQILEDGEYMGYKVKFKN